jgi:hypothetical protein
LTYNECSFIGYPGPDIHFLECNFCDKANYYKKIDTQDCSPQTDLTGFYYLKDEHYPALGKCHDNCATCHGIEKGEYYHNCITCKDPYVLDEETTNCIIIVEEEEEQEEEEEEEI